MIIEVVLNLVYMNKISEGGFPLISGQLGGGAIKLIITSIFGFNSIELVLKSLLEVSVVGVDVESLDLLIIVLKHLDGFLVTVCCVNENHNDRVNIGESKQHETHDHENEPDLRGLIPVGTHKTE